jgi:hypothetical protein
MREKILERFAVSDATFEFADENFLDKSAQKMLKDSGRA